MPNAKRSRRHNTWAEAPYADPNGQHTIMYLGRLRTRGGSLGGKHPGAVGKHNRRGGTNRAHKAGRP